MTKHGRVYSCCSQEVQLSHAKKEQPRRTTANLFSNINVTSSEYSLHPLCRSSLVSFPFTSMSPKVLRPKTKMYPRRSQQTSGSCGRLLFNYFRAAQTKGDWAKTGAVHSPDEQLYISEASEDNYTFRNTCQLYIFMVYMYV